METRISAETGDLLRCVIMNLLVQDVNGEKGGAVFSLDQTHPGILQKPMIIVFGTHISTTASQDLSASLLLFIRSLKVSFLKGYLMFSSCGFDPSVHCSKELIVKITELEDLVI